MQPCTVLKKGLGFHPGEKALSAEYPSALRPEMHLYLHTSDPHMRWQLQQLWSTRGHTAFHVHDAAIHAAGLDITLAEALATVIQMTEEMKVKHPTWNTWDVHQEVEARFKFESGLYSYINPN